MNRNIMIFHDGRNDVFLHDEFLAFALWGSMVPNVN